MVRRALQLFLVLAYLRSSASSNDENAAETFLANFYEEKMSSLCREARLAEWDYATNITDDNNQKMIKAVSAEAEFIKLTWKNVTSYNWREFKNEVVKRKYKLLSVIGTAALSYEEFVEFTKTTSKMEKIYSETTVCDKENKCGLHLDPEITEILATSRDPDQLLKVWKEWHDKVGKAIGPLYPKYVELSNVAAKLNNFPDMAKLWLQFYEDDNFDKKIEKLWNQVKPLYEQLHAYVRRKLNNVYKDKVPLDKPIPAHLLGNMWAQTWENVADLVIPFPNKTLPDATPGLKSKQYDAEKMVKTAEEFYTSMGLEAQPEVFWNKSMITRPTDGTDVICHASAWDFCDRKDVRIKMCTKVTMEDFIVIHHELGHIQYFQQYKDQPIIFRNGANPGFHEAVGDTLALSAATVSHLNKLELLNASMTQDKESDINYLMYKALQKIAFLPFGYVADLWRWEVFKGIVKPSDYNKKWWELRKIYQGIEPAVPRGDNDFDPGAKFHIAADVEYLRYFVAAIIQFQFHQCLCIAANEYDTQNNAKPLHKCDFYENKKAGDLLSSMLRMGSSQPWPAAMKKICGVESMDASAMMEYFKPLHDYLVEENKKNNEKIGWMPDSSPVQFCSLPLLLTALGVVFIISKLNKNV